MKEKGGHLVFMQRRGIRAGFCWRNLMQETTWKIWP